MSVFAQSRALSITLLATFLLALCVSLPALGMSVDEAKASLDGAKQAGDLGEKPTGYLGVVTPGNQAAEIAQAINDARRQEYERIAQKHGVDVTKVEAVAGKKAVEQTPAGQYVMREGEWLRK